MILDRFAVRHAMSEALIVVSPYDPAALRVNSYDVHLSPILRTYTGEVLDCARDNPTEQHIIPPEGFVMLPGRLYLGTTIEYTEAHGLVPWIDGKSSGGRLALSVHVTAGRGDAGFCGHWTLELTVTHPLRVYGGMPVGQLTWMQVAGHGGEAADYASIKGSKYQQLGPGEVDPVPSRMHLNFPLPAEWEQRAADIRAKYGAKP